MQRHVKNMALHMPNCVEADLDAIKSFRAVDWSRWKVDFLWAEK